MMWSPLREAMATTFERFAATLVWPLSLSPQTVTVPSPLSATL